MKYDLAYILTHFDAVHGAVSCEPDISPDLAHLTLARLPVVLLALMNRGLRTFGQLRDYLDQHGAQLDPMDVLKVLSQFGTQSRDAEGRFDGLWRGNHTNGFMPNILATR